MADETFRSGGADLSAHDMKIGRDVVGRDSVQQTTTYYYGATPSQHRRAELPHQPYFFGREEELARVADALDPESNGWGVLIDGPGALAKRRWRSAPGIWLLTRSIRPRFFSPPKSASSRRRVSRNLRTSCSSIIWRCWPSSLAS